MGLISLFRPQQPPPPPPQQQQPTANDEPKSDQTVAPAGGASESSGTGNNTSSNDAGTGGNGANSGQATPPPDRGTSAPPPRPAQATASSVVQAQTAEPARTQLRVVDESSARNAALAAQARARDTALIDSIAAPQEVPTVKKSVVTAEPTNPLPTAPVLQRLSKTA